LATARVVIRDWNANKIPYFSIPPVVHPSSLPSTAPGAENVGEATIVQGGFSAAFSLGDLYGEAMQQNGDEQNVHEGPMDEDGQQVSLPLRSHVR
jgi:nuclear GTP-binding protein